MRLVTATPSPHLDDGGLVRLLDQEGSAGERARLGVHVGACDACQRRQEALATWTRAVSEVLTRSDMPVRTFGLARDGRDRGAIWRWWPAAAAAVLLVVGTVALAAPLGTWMVERWGALRHVLLTPGAPRRAPTRVGDQAPPQASSAPVGVVSFTPDSDVLLVRVAKRQAEGSLVVEASPAPTASATVRGQGEHEAIVVLPAELRIANTAASRATYRITLPAHLKRLVVQIDDEPAVSLTPVAPGESHTLDLKTKRRR